MEQNIEIAHNLSKMGLSIEQIAKAAGLTEAEIKNLYSQPLNTVWAVFFPPYRVVFPYNPSGLLRKTSLSDGKNPRPSGILRL